MIIFVDENAKRWGAQVGGIYISRGRFFSSERAQLNSPAPRAGERKDELPALQGRDDYFASSVGLNGWRTATQRAAQGY